MIERAKPGVVAQELILNIFDSDLASFRAANRVPCKHQDLKSALRFYLYKRNKIRSHRTCYRYRLRRLPAFGILPLFSRSLLRDKRLQAKNIQNVYVNE